MDSEFQERLRRLEAACEEMMAAVGKLQEAEAESSNRKRVNSLENRVDALEDSGE